MSIYLLLTCFLGLLILRVHLKGVQRSTIIDRWCDAGDIFVAWRKANPTTYISQSEKARELLRELIDAYEAFLQAHPFIKDRSHKEYLLSLFSEIPPEPPKPRKRKTAACYAAVLYL